MITSPSKREQAASFLYVFPSMNQGTVCLFLKQHCLQEFLTDIPDETLISLEISLLQ